MMTIPSTNGGDAATNVPVKPLRRERIRCKKLSRGLRSYPGIETIPAAGLSTAVARAGVVVRLASAKGRDPCRLRRRYRSSRVNNVQHLQLALLNTRSLSWQRPTTRDKLYDIISYVRKSKINIACISEMKNFNPEGEAISFVFVEEYMFILAESTGIILDPMCRIAFQNGGSVVRAGSERSILIRLQFPKGSLAVGAIYFPTGVAAAMRDLELVNVLSLIHLAKSWKMPLYLGVIPKTTRDHKVSHSLSSLLLKPRTSHPKRSVAPTTAVAICPSNFFERAHEGSFRDSLNHAFLAAMRRFFFFFDHDETCPGRSDEHQVFLQYDSLSSVVSSSLPGHSPR